MTLSLVGLHKLIEGFLCVKSGGMHKESPLNLGGNSLEHLYSMTLNKKKNLDRDMVKFQKSPPGGVVD